MYFNKFIYNVYKRGRDFMYTDNKHKLIKIILRIIGFSLIGLSIIGAILLIILLILNQN